MAEKALQQNCPSEIPTEELLKMREGMTAEQMALLMAQIAVPYLQENLHMAMSVMAATQILFQQRGMSDTDVGIAQLQATMLAEAAAMCETLMQTLPVVTNKENTPLETVETARAEVEELLRRRGKLQEVSARYEDIKRDLLIKHFETISSAGDSEDVKIVARQLAESLNGTGVCGPAKGNA